LMAVSLFLASRPKSTGRVGKFSVDAIAVTGKPLRLFQHHVRPFSIAPDLISPWRQSLEAEWVTIDSPGYAFLELGETKLKDFELSVEIQQSVWTGEAGLFLGGKEVQLANGKRGAECQVVYILCNDADVFRVERKISRFEFVDHGLDYREGLTFADANVRRPNPGEFPRLEVKVANGTIEQISWAGEQLQELAGPNFQSRRPLISLDGSFGILTYRGATRFRGATLTPTR
jgi:hypothetical protein